MSDKTKIEWCDASLSPWWGCTKVSEGCKNCYAETITNRFKGDHWGKGKPRLKQPNFEKNALALNRKAKRLGKRLKVFPSMCDWLDEEVPIEWLADFLKVIHHTYNLDWLLLTKRPENFESRVNQVFRFIGSNSLIGDYVIENVCLGVSVENQEQADKRIPELLKIPAKIRFLSCEPLLGPIDLSHSKIGHWKNMDGSGSWFSPVPGKMFHSLIHWVITGGESGPKARPMHPDWARSIRDQCVKAGVPFFFKQWGEWVPFEPFAGGDLGGDMRRGIVEHVCADRENDGHFRRGDCYMRRVGKKDAGRLLDGMEWNQFPEIENAEVVR